MREDAERLLQSILAGLVKLQDSPPVLPGALAELTRIDEMVWAVVDAEKGHRRWNIPPLN